MTERERKKKIKKKFEIEQDEKKENLKFYKQRGE